MSRVRRVPIYFAVQPSTELTRVIGRPYLLWALANGAGHAVATALIAVGGLIVAPFVSVQVTGEDLGPLIIILAMIGLLTGAMVGIAEGIVLRRYLTIIPIWEWVLFTTIGGTGAWVTGPILIVALLLSIAWVSYLPCIILLGAALSGAWVGATQRWVLLKYVGTAGSWLWVNILAGIIFVFGTLFFASLWGNIRNVQVFNGSPEALIVGEIMGGFLYGAVTSVAFVRLLRSVLR
jgi:hypothetical protein